SLVSGRRARLQQARRHLQPAGDRADRRDARTDLHHESARLRDRRDLRPRRSPLGLRRTLRQREARAMPFLDSPVSPARAGFVVAPLALVFGDRTVVPHVRSRIGPRIRPRIRPRAWRTRRLLDELLRLLVPIVRLRETRPLAEAEQQQEY